MPLRFSRPIYALQQLKERILPSASTVTFTLAIEYGESILSVHQGDKLLWTQKIPFAATEWVDAVVAWMLYRHKLLIGIPMAERILIEIGSVLLLNPDLAMKVKGRNQTTGLPDAVEVEGVEIRKQIAGLPLLVDRLKWFTGQTRHHQTKLPRIPDEFLQALRHTPIVITGKYGWLKGLPEFLENELGYKFIRADV
jgi:actin-like ATPase involved in cell morphogenesis